MATYKLVTVNGKEYAYRVYGNKYRRSLEMYENNTPDYDYAPKYIQSVDGYDMDDIVKNVVPSLAEIIEDDKE